MELSQRNANVIRTVFDKQPYDAVIDGIDITIGKGVFPSDLGLTTKYLINVAKKYNPKIAIDMGCGSGVIAIALKKMGVSEVWASDIHTPAIECTKDNIKKYKEFGEINVIESNLFENIRSGIKFELIIFNHPYGPTKNKVGRYGGGGEGGKDLIIKFFTQVKDYMHESTRILMPFSEIAGEENDAKLISKDFGFQVKTVFEISDPEYGRHTIYEFSI